MVIRAPTGRETAPTDRDMATRTAPTGQDTPPTGRDMATGTAPATTPDTARGTAAIAVTEAAMGAVIQAAITAAMALGAVTVAIALGAATLAAVTPAATRAAMAAEDTEATATDDPAPAQERHTRKEQPVSGHPKAGEKVSYAPVANCTYFGVASGDPFKSDAGMDVINITITVALTDVEKWPYVPPPPRAINRKAA